MSGTERTRCWKLFKSQPTVSHPCRRQARYGPKAKPAHQMPALTTSHPSWAAEGKEKLQLPPEVTIWAAHLLCHSAQPAVTPPHRRAAHRHPPAAWWPGGWLCTKRCALIFFSYVFSSSAIVPHNWCGTQKQQVLLSNLYLWLFSPCPTVISVTWRNDFCFHLVICSQLQRDLTWSLLTMASVHYSLCCDPHHCQKFGMIQTLTWWLKVLGVSPARNAIFQARKWVIQNIPNSQLPQF